MRSYHGQTYDDREIASYVRDAIAETGLPDDDAPMCDWADDIVAAADECARDDRGRGFGEFDDIQAYDTAFALASGDGR